MDNGDWFARIVAGFAILTLVLVVRGLDRRVDDLENRMEAQEVEMVEWKIDLCSAVDSC